VGHEETARAAMADRQEEIDRLSTTISTLETVHPSLVSGPRTKVPDEKEIRKLSERTKKFHPSDSADAFWRALDYKCQSHNIPDEKRPLFLNLLLGEHAVARLWFKLKIEPHLKNSDSPITWAQVKSSFYQLLQESLAYLNVDQWRNSDPFRNPPRDDQFDEHEHLHYPPSPKLSSSSVSVLSESGQMAVVPRGQGVRQSSLTGKPGSRQKRHVPRGDRECVKCHTRETTQWREGGTLCNVCSLRKKRRLRRQQERFKNLIF
jgi:hypothetical protein